MVGKERWASRLGLVLAMAGNAVGLGNFLRFPAQVVKNNGGAFIIPYLVALVVLGLPLIWIEWSMGRYGGKHGHHSAPGVFDCMGKRPFWKYLGVFGLWSNLVIAAYYLYIESWTMAYAGYSAMGGFSEQGASAKFFTRLIGDQTDKIYAVSWFGLIIFFLCMAINVFILSRGLAKGIELVAKIGMPLLIAFAAILAIRGLTLSPGVDGNVVESPWKGLNYIWEPKFESLWDSSIWLAAAGQIFFTLSIGMGSIHCYASYVREQDDIALTGASAAWTNEFCEVILGGSILVPIAVAYLGVSGMEDTIKGSSGLQLGFVVFPEMFRNWGGGLAPAAGFMWFGLLFFAAITSSLAMGQPIMAFLQSEFKYNRMQSALAFGAMLLPLTIPVACFNLDTFFSEFDYWAGTFALVVLATVETVLFAWVFGMNRGWAEITSGAEIRVPRLFYYIIKYVTPNLLIVILASYVFQPTAGWDTYLKHITQGTIREAPPWEWSPDGMIGQLLFKGLSAKEAKLAADLEALVEDPASDKQRAELEIDLRLVSQTRLAQIFDRLVMIGAFAFFCMLVAIAWRRRRAEGRIET